MRVSSVTGGPQAQERCRSPWGSIAKNGLRSSVAMVLLATAQLAQAADPTPPSPAACDPYKDYSCLDAYLGTGFWERFINYQQLEWGQAAGPSDPNAPPSRRDYYPPAAQTTPPMPYTEWPYGGTTSLGVTRPNSVDSPLMVALANTDFGTWMGKNNLQLYGWVDVGANLSTSSVRGGNAPAAYDYVPNTIQLDQAVLYLDRFPDTVQTDHIDWGLRLSAIYGVDYRYTTSYGLASYQLLQKNRANGYDFPMFYGEIFDPKILDGFMVRVGRYISLPDIEAQLAPNNYMYSHSMTYTFDNYTNTGIQTTLALDKNYMLQVGLSAGTEAALPHLWETENNPYPNRQGAQPGQVGYNPIYPGSTFKVDPGALPSWTLCARYNSDDGKTDVNACANALNRGTYGYNNLQWYGLTAYHQITPEWHIAFEAYHLYENDVPNANNSTVQTVYANGGAPFSSHFIPFNAPDLAICSNAGVLTCRANAYGTVTYLNYSPDPLNNFSIRPEYFSDPQGQRTGIATKYTNLAFGWQHWFSPQVEVRPELAYYRSLDGPAFNGNANAGIAPNKSHETILSGDLIWHF